MAVLVSGLGVVPGTLTTAEAGTVETNYILQSTGYGTRVTLNDVEVAGGRTGFSWIACTRLAGIRKSNAVVSSDVPLDPSDPDSPSLIQVGTAKSTNRTYRDLTNGIVAAAQGTATIADVALGLAGGPRLKLVGLKSTSTAWATKAGRLRVDNTVDVGDIDITGVAPQTGATPLDALIGALDGGLNEVLDVLRDNAEGVEIPGLGRIYIGDYDRTVFAGDRSWAYASSYVLRVVLYGADGKGGTADDLVVNIGRSFAKITKGVSGGVMLGRATAFNGTVLNGVVGVGDLGSLPLPCHGTRGNVRQDPVVGLDAGGAGQLEVKALNGRVYGVQRKDGSAQAWTEGSAGSIKIGPLEIKGIVGRVNVRMDRRKRAYSTYRGSSVGEIVMDGKSLGSFDVATASQIPALDVPGVAKVEFFKRAKHKRGAEIAAVTITLLEAGGDVTTSTIRLGYARARILRA